MTAKVPRKNSRRCLLLAVPRMENIRHGVAPGWLGFCLARVEPQGNYAPIVHGNWKHGGFSKQARLARQQLKEIRRSLRTRSPLKGSKPLVPGWRLYPFVHRGVPPCAVLGTSKLPRPRDAAGRFCSQLLAKEGLSTGSPDTWS